MPQTGVFVRRIVLMSMLVLAVVTVGDSALPVGAAQPLAEANPTMGSVKVEASMNDADNEAVDWAVDRYREAGLSLPDMVVSFHADAETCEGAHGGHRIEDGTSRVLICIPEEGPTRDLKIKRVLLHEFAHAWDHHALTDQQRSQFMTLKDFSGWSFEVPYDERASEDAADILTFGLMDRPILISRLDETWSWEERREGYRILTGAEPPHGYVWSFFAAAHDVYAHTPAQVEAVEKAWEMSEDDGRLTESIEVRFNQDPQSCNDAVTSSELVGDRLHIQACPGSESEVTTALFNEFTGG